jgi:hypothetical protein
MKFNDLLQENESEYQKAKIESDKLKKEVDRFDKELQKYPRNNSGMVSDETLQSKEYKQDKLNFQKAFKSLQDFNKIFSKKFKKEIRYEYNK